jgi:2',3'-cyclic-nucleotide 2'-phosphodiesterase (5'-nucleotidase family)
VFSSALVLAACGGDDDKSSRLPEAGTAQPVVLETTDLHANLLSYDYFKLAEDKSVGFERTATLIRQARAEFPNTVLIDNGDTIQDRPGRLSGAGVPGVVLHQAGHLQGHGRRRLRRRHPGQS